VSAALAGRSTRPVPTVFLGSGSFAVPILEALANAPEAQLVGVVTGPPRPAGRGGRLRRSPVAQRAEDLGLGPVLAPARLRAPAAVAEIAGLGPRLLVVADYGQLVPRELLTLPPHGALGVHPSLLPRHRGAAPIPAAILAGDRQSGVTLMVLDEGLDSGPIVAQVAVPLHGTETAPELEALLAAQGAQLLRAVLGDWLAGRRRAQPQPASGVTLTRPLRRDDGRLDPALDAATLERQVRAYQPWPGTWTETVAGRLIVWRARPLPIAPAETSARDAAVGPRAERPSAERPSAERPSTERPSTERSLGRIVADDGGLALLVADGALCLEEVQLAGGRRLRAAELRRGHPELVGSRISVPALP
jgi:methionyl-tRNA formyltransferase